MRWEGGGKSESLAEPWGPFGPFTMMSNLRDVSRWAHFGLLPEVQGKQVHFRRVWAPCPDLGSAAHDGTA